MVSSSFSDFLTKHFPSSLLETEGSDEACTQVQAGHGLQLYLHKIDGSNLNWYDLGLLTARIRWSRPFRDRHRNGSHLLNFP